MRSSNTVQATPPGWARTARGGLGVALRLVPEPLPAGVHLHAALHDHGPGDQDPVRVGDVAVALVGAEVARCSAQRLPPAQRLAAVAVVAEPERIGDRGHVAAHEVRVPPEAVAGQDQAPAAHPLLAPVGAAEPDPLDPPALREQRLGAGGRTGSAHRGPRPARAAGPRARGPCERAARASAAASGPGSRSPPPARRAGRARRAILRSARPLGRGPRPAPGRARPRPCA